LIAHDLVSEPVSTSLDHARDGGALPPTLPRPEARNFIPHCREVRREKISDQAGEYSTRERV